MDTNDKEMRTTEQLYGLRKLAVRLHLKGLEVSQLRHLKDVEAELARLKRMAAFTGASFAASRLS